ncbi:MAG: hypothetical protein FWG80_04900 [Alphaproteobacteria bacterium]|nr:hypothetical protein [Alphaproteobacteria bacterium]
MIIRKAVPRDAKCAATTHSIAANKAYDTILPDADRHFSVHNLTEFWKNQIQNSIDYPDLYRALVAQNSATEKIAGVCLASVANEKYDGHILPLLRKASIGVNDFKDTIIGNINTIYIHPDYQRHGLGSRFIYDIACSKMLESADWLITETLDRYEVSPKFFMRLGARNIGSYTISVGEHYRNDDKMKDESVNSQVWVMKKDEVILNLWLLNKSNIIQKVRK